MRDQRLLPWAALVLALGLAASAYADIAVTTVIIDPNGDPNTWQVSARMWGDGGANTAATSAGSVMSTP